MFTAFAVLLIGSVLIYIMIEVKDWIDNDQQ